MPTDTTFEVTDSGLPGVPVLAVRGEIDVATSPDMRELLQGLIEGEPQLLVVDMTDVSFIDSTGLGVLVEAVTGVRAGGGDLRLVVTQPHIIKLFELTGLDEVFSVTSSTREAARS
jgi:anti-sigma B factor antagonist